MKEDIKLGISDSLPIAFGYFPVSFTFGMIATSLGLPSIIATIISAFNFTSAGQFAGLNIILDSGGYIEMAITIFIINIRYMLMSLSLSQKIPDLSIKERLLVGFGITDEIFAVASIKKGILSFGYLAGLILLPYIGWTMGTLSGALISNLLSERLKNAMGIALYGMFLAIIVPEAKKNKKIFKVIAIAVGVSLLFNYTTFLNNISQGWVIVICTVISSLLGALLFPRRKNG